MTNPVTAPDYYRRFRECESSSDAAEVFIEVVETLDDYKNHFEACEKQRLEFLAKLDAIRSYCGPSEKFTQSEYAVCRDILLILAGKEPSK